MNCLHCHSQIEADSCYCDQCGEEIKVCPQCGAPGARNRCKFDGAVLVAAKTLQPSAAPAMRPAPAGNNESNTEKARPVLTLINNNLGLHYQPQPSDVIGRREGPLAHLLQSHGRVSGRHAEVHYTPEAGWTLTDTQSTNGTTYNGRRLAPHQPIVLQDGGSLVLGQAVELYTRLEAPAPKPGAPLAQPAQRPASGTIRV